MDITEAIDKTSLIINQHGRAEYKRGLKVCLSEMEKIAGWLTEQPDTKRQARLREMVERRIALMAEIIAETKD